MPEAETKRERGALYCVSVLILLLLGSMVIVPILLLPLRIAVSSFTFFISACLALILYFCLFGANKASLRRAFAAAAIVAAGLIFSGLILDVSYDGIAYQKAAIGAMKDGWNPAVESIDTWSQSQPMLKNTYFYGIWVDHYPKATWYISAAFYAITGNIEHGKAYTILMMVACFGILREFLIQRRLPKWTALIVSALAVINPITVAQVTTFYNDAFLMLTLFVILIALVWLFYEKSSETFLALFFALVVCTNIKFTGLAFAFAFSLANLALLLFWSKRKKERLRKLLVPAALIFVGVVFLALLGGPYIKNFSEHGHFLYPLAGESSIDIISNNEPAAFSGRSSLYKIFYSIFSYSADINGAAVPNPVLRVPFTFAENELEAMGLADLRIGGFGAFFGPILVVSAVLIFIFMIKLFKQNKMLFSILLAETFVVCALMLVMSESWWARYSGYFYGVVVVALILCFKSLRGGGRKWTAVPSVLLSLLVLANAMLFLPVDRVQRGISHFREIAFLKSVAQTGPLSVYLGDESQRYTGLYHNLKDENLWFELAPEILEGMAPALDGRIFYSAHE